ncbi:TrmH family RNA methyltransferase [Salinivirga cyanobacteriivorans]
MKQLIAQLKEFISEERFHLFENILQNRTNYITVAIEDIYQSHNASAVLRSCDCFGIQTVHVVEQQNEFIPNPEVAMGSSKWLNINHYKNKNALPNAISTLKKQNYRVVATTPHQNDTLLPDFNLEKGPVALLFGTEMRGLSHQAIDLADEYLKIPMYGFTESFNISVSVAIILNELRQKLNKSSIPWQLNEQEYEETLFKWIKASIKRPELIIERLQQTKKNNPTD